jgi:succinate dehydrogenase / fumarate reductase cytochrome b subunit
MTESPSKFAYGTEDLAARRPLSPHLQIYRPLLTMMMSIVHRITGAALYLGTLLLVWWLVALASGPDAFATAQWFMTSILGRLILFGYTWALLHHMLGGIRHFIWDTGKGFDEKTRENLAKATLIGSVVLTILTWIAAYAVR